ncbi:hypothetical protein HDU87_007641 [Geranomyces variabilis]|uniref:Gelsolin-like domain-containing protein n=1 Tax=Geranomyces variabilis TaxID=109894 RepID=A0AAD5XK99_9FUNG|nr:hypothetical protein HDU87_007641 [Geranomyces variabilis]
MSAKPPRPTPADAVTPPLPPPSDETTSTSPTSSSSATPGSMTPRARARYDARRESLLAELDSHDRVTESRDLDWRLRKEVFASRLRKEDERFERIRRKRVAESVRDMKARARELEKMEMEVETARTTRLASSPTSRPSSVMDFSSLGLPPPASTGSPRPQSTMLAGSAKVDAPARPHSFAPSRSPARSTSRHSMLDSPQKESEQATQELFAFQDERRAKKLARQAAEDARKRAEAALREELERKLEAEFHDEDDEDEVEETRGRQSERNVRPPRVVVEAEPTKDLGVRRSWNPIRADTGGRSSADGRSLSPAAAQVTGRAGAVSADYGRYSWQPMTARKDVETSRDRSLSPSLSVSPTRSMEPAGRVRPNPTTEEKKGLQYTHGLLGVEESSRPHQPDRVANDTFHAEILSSSKLSQSLNVPAAKPVAAPAKLAIKEDLSNASTGIDRQDSLSDLPAEKASGEPKRTDLTEEARVEHTGGLLDSLEKVDVTADNAAPIPPPELGVLEPADPDLGLTNSAEPPANVQESESMSPTTDNERAPLELVDTDTTSSQLSQFPVTDSAGVSDTEAQTDHYIAQDNRRTKMEIPTGESEVNSLQAEVATDSLELGALQTEGSLAEWELAVQHVSENDPRLAENIQVGAESPVAGYASDAFHQLQESQPSLGMGDTDREETELPAAELETERVRGSPEISVHAAEETHPAGLETVLSEPGPDTMQPSANGELSQPPATQPDTHDLLAPAPLQSRSEEGVLPSSEQEAELPESLPSFDVADSAASEGPSEQPLQVEEVEAKDVTPFPLPEGNDATQESRVGDHDAESNVPSSEDIIANRDDRPVLSSEPPAVQHAATTTAHPIEVGAAEAQPDVSVKPEAELKSDERDVPVNIKAEPSSHENNQSYASLSLDPLLAAIASLSGAFESDEPAIEAVSTSSCEPQLLTSEDQYSHPAAVTTAVQSPDAGVPISGVPTNTQEESTNKESFASLSLDPLLTVMASLSGTFNSTTRAEEDGSGPSSDGGLAAEGGQLALDRDTLENAPISSVSVDPQPPVPVSSNDRETVSTHPAEPAPATSVSSASVDPQPPVPVSSNDRETVSTHPTEPAPATSVSSASVDPQPPVPVSSNDRETVSTHPTEPAPVTSVSVNDDAKHVASVDALDTLPSIRNEETGETQPQRTKPLLSGPLRIKVSRRRPPSSDHLRQQIHSNRIEHSSTTSATPTTAVEAELHRDGQSPPPGFPDKKVGRNTSAVPPILMTTLHTYGSPPTGLTAVSLLSSPTVSTPSTALAPSPAASRAGAPSPSALANSPRLKKASPFPNCSPEATLILFKGRRRIHATRIATAEWSSMNKSDAFVLVAPTLDADGAVQGAKVYVWAGAEAGKVKKSKAREFAGRVIEREWGRKAAELVTLESDSEPTTESIAFWRLLGVPSGLEPPDLKPMGDDDVEHEKIIEQRTQLYGINDDKTALVVVSPSGKTLSHKVFQPGKCFVLDCFDEIFVWIGRGAGDTEKALVKAFAEKLSLNPNRTPVQVMHERDGAERVLFRERFADWPADAGTGGVMEVRLPTNVEAKDKTRGVYVRGSDEPKPTHINIADMYNGKSKLVAASPTLHAMPGTLADRISLQTTYSAPANTSVGLKLTWFFLYGKKTERAAAALLATTLEKQHAARLVRVEEGKEPADFIGLFAGGAIVRRGSRTSAPSEKAMFHFHCPGAGPVRCAETMWSANALSSLDSFVLVTKGNIFIWNGAQSPPSTRAAARQACAHLSSQSPVEVTEGAEPKALQRALDLSSRKTRQSNPSNVSVVPRALRLFRVSHVSGGPTAEEIDPFMAGDLSPGNVYILDAGTDVFLWVGAEARRDRHADVKLGLETVLAYTTFANQQGRALPSSLVVMAGSEPQAFRAAFCAWDAYVPATHEDGDEAGSSHPTTILGKLKRLGSKKRSQSEPETAEATLEKVSLP